MRIRRTSSVRLLRFLLAAGAGSRPQAAFTLVEVLISSAIVALVFGGIINCYIQAGVRIQWTGYSLAAQSMANQVLEQARAASWDPAARTGPVNNITNLNLMGTSYDSVNRIYKGFSSQILDVPYSSTNYFMATNFVTVQMVYVNADPKVQMQFVRVDTVWPFYLRKTIQYFTNSVSTMIAPDDRQL